MLSASLGQTARRTARGDRAVQTRPSRDCESVYKVAAISCIEAFKGKHDDSLDGWHRMRAHCRARNICWKSGSSRRHDAQGRQPRTLRRPGTAVDVAGNMVLPAGSKMLLRLRFTQGDLRRRRRSLPLTSQAPLGGWTKSTLRIPQGVLFVVTASRSRVSAPARCRILVQPQQHDAAVPPHPKNFHTLGRFNDSPRCACLAVLCVTSSLSRPAAAGQHACRRSGADRDRIRDASASPHA
jgi:hypothetical protein